VNELTINDFTLSDANFISNHGSSYFDLVEEGRRLLRTTQLFRLKIAKMAIKACTIRHGGKSSGYYTLTEFAKDIGANRKDVSEWVLVYKRVVVHLEKQIKSDQDFNTARRVADRLAKEQTALKKVMGTSGRKNQAESVPPAKVREMFSEEKDRGKQGHGNIYSSHQYAVRSLGLLKQVGAMGKYDKNLVLDINAVAGEIIELAIKIQDETIRLMQTRGK
jgi:hypothetical protein